MARERFKDHAVWITGASSGLGEAMALELAAQGADVAVSARRVDRLERVVKAIEERGRRGLAVACDVTDDAAIAAAVESVRGAFGKIDVVIANAGFAVSGALETLTREDWERQFETNVFGAVSTVMHALPALKETGGRIGVVASVASQLASPRIGVYTASKYALRAFGQTLAMELHGTGVSVTLLHPGYVATEITRVDKDGNFHEDWDDRANRFTWKAEDAARVMLSALWRRKLEYTFTAVGRLGGFLGRHAPGLLHFALTRGKSPT
ncbi:MAG: SDR family NAD(P)-dependent oxidoreductase [Nannocystaceae bacterium]|nr:SDR family NAD(P)-dependent oxidoreductase [Myxococcales bacterium]